MDRRLLLLAPEDNCLVIANPINAGEIVEIDGEPVRVDVAVGIGHKVARREILQGEKMLKYGAVIGHASVHIAIGQHVHTHNLESDYLRMATPTSSLHGSGDRT